MPYAIQSVLILLAPILFAASIYMFLSRIIRSVNGERFSVIRFKWLTKVFVCGDILCFFVQGGGGGMLTQATTQDSIDLGEHIILGGLILQIFIFLLFVITTVIWNKRMTPYTIVAGQSRGTKWQVDLYSLYAVSFLVTIRNVVRCAEYGTGANGYLLTHEWITYIFDALLMAVVLAICVFWYTSAAVKPRRASGVEELRVRRPAK